MSTHVTQSYTHDVHKILLHTDSTKFWQCWRTGGPSLTRRPCCRREPSRDARHL